VHTSWPIVTRTLRPDISLVIDLARLLSGFCADRIDNNAFFDALFRAAELDNGTSSSSKAKETNVLLVLRTVANAFQEGTKTSDGAWIEKVHSHGVCVLVTHTRGSILRSSEFWAELSTKISREDNALPCRQYSLSKCPVFHRFRLSVFPLYGFYPPLAGANWVEQLFLHDSTRGS
jgi:hypothetical protein